jgi:hypothetical protein
MGRCKGEDVRVMGNRQLSHYSAKIIMYDDSGARILNTGMIDLETALNQLDTIISKKLRQDTRAYHQWRKNQNQKSRGNT